MLYEICSSDDKTIIDDLSSVLAEMRVDNMTILVPFDLNLDRGSYFVLWDSESDQVSDVLIMDDNRYSLVN